MIKETIYLVGQISPKYQETYTWRLNVEDYFKNRTDFEIINPCANPFNKSSLEKGYTSADSYKVIGSRLLVPKDRSFVDRSTIGLANLNVYDPDKVIIGSFFELAWYYEDSRKSVIGIFDGDPKTSSICNHPFVRDAIQVWVKSEIEACELIEFYFSKAL